LTFAMPLDDGDEWW